jgi:NADPH:quinone reductase-like Zn-dependent oxidoreductase
MKAIVATRPGDPEVFQIEEYPKPPTKRGEVLIEVKAFGLSHSELLTRQGHSADVNFPHVMGREAVGIVATAPDAPFVPGARVMAIVRDLLPEYPGSYAQYIRVPETHVRQIHPSCKLSWEHLAAIPEMMQTAWNALFRALRLHPADRLLIRGGTTSIGLAATCIAKRHCSFIASTTRQDNRKELLLGLGVKQVLIDDGSLSQLIKSQGLEFTKVLDLVGVKTIADSLQCVKPYGIVCMAGTVGGESIIPNFNPMDAVPSTVCFTTYKGSVDDFRSFPLDTLCHDVENGQLTLPNIRIYLPDQIGEAHRCMEENRAEGKLVVLW